MISPIPEDRKSSGGKPDVFFWLVCPSCEWDCVIVRAETEVGLTCPLCAEDNGRDVYLRGGEGIAPDKVEGYDARITEAGRKRPDRRREDR
jgi:hypothetical protein